VESPQDDGSRRVALVNWVTGESTWLTAPHIFAAQATLLDNGVLFATRDGEGMWSIQAQDGEGTRARGLESEWCVLPTPMASGDRCVAITIAKSGVHAHTVSLSNLASTGPDRLLARPAPAGEEVRAASLCVSSVQPSAWADGDDGAIVFSPLRSTMQLIASDGSIRTFPERAIAAVRWKQASTDGWLASTAKGLVFVPERELGSTNPRVVRVLAGSYVPRLVRDPEAASVLLFGPSAKGAQHLDVVRLVANDAAPTP
jgi:hypothetical protein